MKTFITIVLLGTIIFIIKNYLAKKEKENRITRINPQKIIREANEKKNQVYFRNISKYQGQKRFVKTGNNNYKNQ